MHRLLRVVFLAALMMGGPGDRARAQDAWWHSLLDSSARVYSIEGLDGPEAVRFDPDQDVWFVANFSGDPGIRDGNGFVSRVDARTGAVEDLRFATGTALEPLHAARGMFITGDTLWVNDIDGVHAFDRLSGAHLGFVDLSPFDPGFLNDITLGPDAALYVTDTDRSAMYRIAGRNVSIAARGEQLHGPNGVTWVPELGGLVLVPWRPGGSVTIWSPERGPRALGDFGGAGRMDGVEWLEGRLLVASQTDSTLYAVSPTSSLPVVRVGAAPADIGVDPRRRLVAVPFVGEDRVDVWRLSGGR